MVPIANKDAFTAIHIAAQHNRGETITWLLSHGVPADSPDGGDYRPLLYAIRDGGPAAWNALLAWPNCPMVVNKLTDTPLHVAALNGVIPAIHAMFKHRKELLNARGENDNRPLHHAAFHDKAEAVRVLLNLGAQVFARNTDGATPVLEAARHGKLDALKAFPLESIRNHRVDGIRVNPYSTLHLAAHHGHVEVCREIMTCAPELMKVKVGGKTPLMMASEAGKVDVVELLSNPQQRSLRDILRSPERLKRVGG